MGRSGARGCGSGEGQRPRAAAKAGSRGGFGRSINGGAGWLAAATLCIVLVVGGGGISAVGGDADAAAAAPSTAPSFSHADLNLAGTGKGQSLRRLLQSSDGIKVPPKMYGGELR